MREARHEEARIADLLVGRAVRWVVRRAAVDRRHDLLRRFHDGAAGLGLVVLKRHGERLAIPDLQTETGVNLGQLRHEGRIRKLRRIAERFVPPHELACDAQHKRVVRRVFEGRGHFGQGGRRVIASRTAVGQHTPRHAVLRVVLDDLLGRVLGLPRHTQLNHLAQVVLAERRRVDAGCHRALICVVRGGGVDGLLHGRFAGRRLSRGFNGFPLSERRFGGNLASFARPGFAFGWRRGRGLLCCRSARHICDCARRSCRGGGLHQWREDPEPGQRPQGAKRETDSHRNRDQEWLHSFTLRG